jgi:hypothetical protein
MDLASNTGGVQPGVRSYSNSAKETVASATSSATGSPASKAGSSVRKAAVQLGSSPAIELVRTSFLQVGGP